MKNAALLIAVLVFQAACNENGDVTDTESEDSDSNTNADTDSDSDSDSDSDTVAGTDTDTESDARNDCVGTPNVAQPEATQGLGGNGPAAFFAQSFVPSINELGAVGIFVNESERDLDALTVSVRPDNGGFPDASSLIMGQVNVSLASTDNFRGVCIAFDTIQVEAGKTYWIVVQSPADATKEHHSNWALFDGKDLYEAGFPAFSNNWGNSWKTLESYGFNGDFAFGIFGPI